MRIRVPPFITAVSRPEDLKEVIRHFSNAGFDLQYIEVGWFQSPYQAPQRGVGVPIQGCHAVFFERGHLADKSTQELIAKWKV